MNQNFIAFAESHLDARDRGAYTARREIARVVHRAYRRRLGQSVNLQDADAEHREKQLGLFRKRRRAADQRLQIRPDFLFDRREDQRVGEREPEARRAFAFVLSQPTFLAFDIWSESAQASARSGSRRRRESAPKASVRSGNIAARPTSTRRPAWSDR